MAPSDVETLETTTHRLILSYLIQNCYRETALAFVDAGEESTVNSTNTNTRKFKGEEKLGYAWQSMERRKEIKSCIIKGDIQEAISLCQAYFQDVLCTDPDDSRTDEETIAMSFKLHCQQFVEYVRKSTQISNSSTDAFQMSSQALSFAQSVLARYPDLDRLNRDRYQSSLTEIAGLIAYSDPTNSPVAYYLDQSQRETLASELNAFIMRRMGGCARPPLEDVVRQYSVVHTLLYDRNGKTTDDKKSKQESMNSSGSGSGTTIGNILTLGTTSTITSTIGGWSLRSFLNETSS